MLKTFIVDSLDLGFPNLTVINIINRCWSSERFLLSINTKLIGFFAFIDVIYVMLAKTFF